MDFSADLARFTVAQCILEPILVELDPSNYLFYKVPVTVYYINNAMIVIHI